MFDSARSAPPAAPSPPQVAPNVVPKQTGGKPQPNSATHEITISRPSRCFTVQATNCVTMSCESDQQSTAAERNDVDRGTGEEGSTQWRHRSGANCLEKVRTKVIKNGLIDLSFSAEATVRCCFSNTGLPVDADEDSRAGGCSGAVPSVFPEASPGASVPLNAEAMESCFLELSVGSWDVTITWRGVGKANTPGLPDSRGLERFANQLHVAHVAPESLMVQRWFWFFFLPVLEVGRKMKLCFRGCRLKAKLLRALLRLSFSFRHHHHHHHSTATREGTRES